jgi:hypothetical protein
VVDGDRLDRFVRGRGGARFDPTFEQADFGGGERGLILGRHPRDIVEAPNRLDKAAGGGFSTNDRRAAIAALERQRGGIEPQAGFLLSGSVAAAAAFGKQRFDVANVVRRRVNAARWLRGGWLRGGWLRGGWLRGGDGGLGVRGRRESNGQQARGERTDGERKKCQALRAASERTDSEVAWHRHGSQGWRG